MALNNTTTPALTAQVISVGVIWGGFVSQLGLFARRFLLRESLCRSFDAEAFLLPLSLLDRDVAEGRWRTEGRGGNAGGAAPPVIADSGTRRSEEGSMQLDCLLVPCCVDKPPRFGRPRAAAAQDKRVERLARSAASWSAVWEGAIAL